MARKAVAVDEDRGRYSFALQEPISYAELRKSVSFLRVEEPLLGWEPWRYAVETDRGYWFVSGDSEPREFGQVEED